MTLWVCELSICTMQLWVSICVSNSVLETYAMVPQPAGQMKHPVLCCTLYLSCLLQLSVNICWINEWTNEYVLVTAVTKTDEIWSLPLRSSQSIEHKQQIKYWSCLLASSFFYLETPFHLCLAVFIPAPKWNKICENVPWRSLGRERRLSKYLAEIVSLCWRSGKAIGRNAPTRAAGTWAQLLRITFRDWPEKARTKPLTTPFHQTVHALAAETAVWPLCKHGSPNCMRDLRCTLGLCLGL